MFRQILLKFHKILQIQNNFVKISCFAKFLQYCQPPYEKVEEEEGRSEGGPADRPSAPSLLTQIVPNSASRYTVFHSVIFNSVILYP